MRTVIAHKFSVVALKCLKQNGLLKVLILCISYRSRYFSMRGSAGVGCSSDGRGSSDSPRAIINSVSEVGISGAGRRAPVEGIGASTGRTAAASEPGRGGVTSKPLDSLIHTPFISQVGVRYAGRFS
jgi:hypothetical protein